MNTIAKEQTLAPPPKPALALNVAVAGARKIPADIVGQLDAKIDEVLSAIEEILVSLKAGEASPYPLCAYYSKATPTLRLVSGLADGADQRVAERVRQRGQTKVEHQLGAVLPFALETYRDCSRIDNTELFDTLLKACTWVHALDGHYETDPGDSADEAGKLFAKRSRARAYRAQSDILLRQCDVLIALSDPAEAGSAGGTRETLMSAIALGVYVVHISLKDLQVSFLDERWALADLPFAAPPGDWREKLRQAIAEIVAAPFHIEQAEPDQPSTERAFLNEFFSPAPEPTLRRRITGWRDARLQHVWKWVDDLMTHSWTVAQSPAAKAKESTATSESNKTAAPAKPVVEKPSGAASALDEYRRRASRLTAHYVGLYRGAFFLNYTLAVFAVFFAATGLLIYLSWQPISGSAAWLIKIGVLMVLALTKLAILIMILWTARAAHKYRWNEKAVDFRYVAERLRAMSYLPRAGVLRPPPPSITRVKPHRVQTTIADWLAMAVIRAVQLGEGATPLALNAEQALDVVDSVWLQEQVTYHDKNAGKTALLTDWLDRRARRFSIIVVGVVALDLLILILELNAHGSPIEFARGLSPLLIFIAVVLPAAVAGANGIRFQSECERLADRSKVFSLVLADMRREAAELKGKIGASAPNPGSWVAPAGIFTERCAQLFIDEVAEWSVLYAKELGEA